MTRNTLPSPCLVATALVSLLTVSELFAESEATGVVFHDKNGNGTREAGEPGIPGIAVSNQREIVTTDAEGRWTLPSDDDTIFFVIKPANWATPVSEHQIPQFYYIHKPNGSPPDFRYAGVAPTGPLPESIDFPLTPAEEPDTFKAILFGDPQPADLDQIDYIAHDVIAELVGTDAKFGVTLGDIMFDKLEFFEPENANIALIGIPWYNVIGNHDLNFDSETDADSDETFHRIFGPNYYSFDYGPVHFIVLDDVEWGITRPDGKRTYRGGLDERQLTFVKNDLARVPEEKLVVLMMHIPLTEMENRTDLYRLIEQRPYSLSISGHTHWQAHQYIDEKDGWRGPKPHHHIVNVTVCGTWWKGEKDEVGIPHATMRDGAPNGYSIITFDGTSHVLDFKAARQPADYQMNIHAPDEMKLAAALETMVHVNVFNGSKDSVVRMRVGESEEWITLEKTLEPDPYYSEVRQREMERYPDSKNHLNAPIDSDHLWKAALPEGLKTGPNLIRVEATDAYGRKHVAERLIRVE
ncbi:MAG: calcineurin-like phosphoesterase family protein [Verrucomicrobiae bacterium]|nr:calcineurin-like phosphoesterase family protein [Verrucomicrobiae bacterium]